MPSTVPVSPSGVQAIDGLLSPQKWATTSLTYSFPASAAFYEPGSTPNGETSGFSPVTAAQQTYVRWMVAQVSAVTMLTFTEVTETASEHGDLRFARSTTGPYSFSESAWSYLPSSDPSGGDSWFTPPGANPNYPWGYEDPVFGNTAGRAFLHELGHALGLLHAHDSSNPWGALPSGRETAAYSVMSYENGASSPFAIHYYGQPHTLMQSDIAALQYLYGANFDTNAGDTHYQWSPTTGEMFVDGVGQGAPYWNSIFNTVWDGGGIDTYDFSNYTTNLSVDLRPGAWTIASVDQQEKMGPFAAFRGPQSPGNIANALLYNGDLRSIIERAVGGPGNDTIIGNVVRNELYGGAGNDTLSGLEGDDGLDGGPGDDLLDGGSGSDVLTGGPGNDTYVVDTAGDSVVESAGGGTDTVRASVSFTLSSELENLTLLGTADLAGTGNALGNVIIGNSASNVLDGGAGDDQLDGGGGADMLRGGPGDDTYTIDADDTVVDEAGASDMVRTAVSYLLGAELEHLTLLGSDPVIGTGNAADNLLVGNVGDNVLNGGHGSDTLSGGAGNDSLFGGVGANVMFGGTGNDIFYVESESDQLFESVAEGDDTVFTAVSFTLPAHIENIGAIGTTAGLTITGNALINCLYANGAGSILRGEGGEDVLFGGPGPDMLFGGGDRDHLVGGGGIDHSVGGPGDDIYYPQSTSDVLLEDAGEGNDTVFAAATFVLGPHIENLMVTGSADLDASGNASANVVYGNSGNNIVAGHDGDDVLFGFGGEDSLDGGPGVDAMHGGAGNDLYQVDQTADQVFEDPGEGVDTVFATASFTLGAEVENLMLLGTGDLNGSGNAGDNWIYATSGTNTLTGAGGRDIFVFAAIGGADTIADFDATGGAGGDRIHIQGTGSFSDVTVTASGADSILTTANGANITLTGVAAGQVDSSDFLFL